MKQRYFCLMCSKVVDRERVLEHKATKHKDVTHYGIMWPLEREETLGFDEPSSQNIPVYDSEFLVGELNVAHVYIRDEGRNFSGSMKDFIVERAIKIGIEQGAEIKPRLF